MIWSVVCLVTQAYFAIFSSMLMGRTTTFSVCMEIRRTLFDHNLRVLFKVQQEYPSKFLVQSHEPIKGIGRMDFWRHSRLLQIPGLQKGTQTSTERRLKNVYSVLVNAEC